MVNARVADELETKTDEWPNTPWVGPFSQARKLVLASDITVAIREAPQYVFKSIVVPCRANRMAVDAFRPRLEQPRFRFMVVGTGSL
jgi:hypothetical protein